MQRKKRERYWRICSSKMRLEIKEVEGSTKPENFAQEYKVKSGD